MEYKNEENLKFHNSDPNTKYMQESLSQDLQTLLDSYDGCVGEKKIWESYFKNYLNIHELFLKSEPIEWEKISPPNDGMIINYETIENAADPEITKYLHQLVVVKLNGGLGTTMGCSTPKSLIQVREGLTFLDITLNQLEYINKKYNVNIPLILMNSYNTDVATKKVLPTYENYRTKVYSFLQATCPRIDSQTHRPIAAKISTDVKEWWYPPGHGNFYEAFTRSGFLDQFIEEGKKVAFVSNIDNLGATIDEKILGLMLNSRDGTDDLRYDYVIEVTDKTKTDIKGGTIISYDGHPRLLEIAQVPKKHEEDFKSVRKFKIFNTNNIWAGLSSIKKLVQEGIDLDVIVNKKVLSNGHRIIQLETAIGAAIKNFKNAIGVNVPRCRFLPVKNNSDLFLIQSNIYTLTKSGFMMNPLRQFQTTPYVKLSGSHFQEVQEYMKRFDTIPDILDLDHLTVSGDVHFESNTTLKGTVVIIAPSGQHIDIAAGSIIENKIVSGHLSIISN